MESDLWVEKWYDKAQGLVWDLWDGEREREWWFESVGAGRGGLEISSSIFNNRLLGPCNNLFPFWLDAEHKKNKIEQRRANQPKKRC